MSEFSVPQRLDFPSTSRNRAPILDVLRDALPRAGVVLEVASGSGQHVAAFAPAFPGLIWQPTDIEEDHLASIVAWTDGLPNVRPPRHLDVQDVWSVGPVDAILCINMIHIAPWACAEGLMRGAGAHLGSGAPLILYGPFRCDGGHTSASNAQFDASLRSRDPAWGVRDLEAVVAAASSAGLTHTDRVQMPANNLSLVFRAG